jgi:hypothetical protein
MAQVNRPSADDSHYAASVMPEVQQADPSFHATGSLLIPNSMSTINGVSASSFLNQLLPYASKASPMTIAENQVQGQRNEQS